MPLPLIGVLALQGGFPAHTAALEEAGAAVREIRKNSDLNDISGIVLPGGESTVQSMLIDRYGLRNDLIRFCKSHPVMATCAGLIMAASGTSDPRVVPLNLIDIDVERNAYGSQLESFTETLSFTPPGKNTTAIPGVFIRAPRITRIGKDITILATKGQDPIAILSGRILALTFHPELASDRTVHRFFLEL